MGVQIGISPIAWQNDDLPQLTRAFSIEQALSDAREIGYTGVERGQRMPRGTEDLRAYLDRYDLALCGGWCSGQSLIHEFAAETEAVAEQVAQFVALDAPCIVYAECSNTVQGQAHVAVAKRPRLDRDQIRAYAARLSDLARWMADQNMPMAYHHHMGTVIEAEDDVNWLMEYTSEAVGLCFDTGHLRFAGGDVMATLDRWGDRVRHVHYKDIRADVVADVHARNRSFLDAVIAGAFTVPGDGDIDFEPVTRFLHEMGYAGWIVVEAEQDPAKAPPYEYSQKGYTHILQVCQTTGLEIRE